MRTHIRRAGIVECETRRPLWLPYVEVVDAPAGGEVACWRRKFSIGG